LYAWVNFVEDVGNLAAGYGDSSNENLTKWMRKNLVGVILMNALNYIG
jgi:hypothetical protein